MEILFQILLLIAVLKFSCKATFLESLWGIWIYAFSAAVLAFVIYPIVIRQPGNFYIAILSSPAFVSDIAIVVTIEAIVGMLVSIGMLKNMFTPQRNLSRWLKILPGVLIFGAVFYIEQRTFYLFAGYDFKFTALVISLGLLLLIFSVATLIKILLPERTLRYEFKFLLNILLLVGGVVLNAGDSFYNTSQHSGVEWMAIIAFLALVFVVGCLGFVLHRLAYKNKKLKKLQKWI